MKRYEASELGRKLLDAYELKDWGIRLSPNNSFVGLCDRKGKNIYLNLHHVDTHPDSEIKDTILHEIAHCLTPNDHEHGSEWQAMAIKVGTHPSKVCRLGFNAEAIDAIRSGHKVDVIETKSVTYKITKNNELCPVCLKLGKESVAIVKKEIEKGDYKIITYDCDHVVMKELPKAPDYQSIIFDGKVDCKHTFTLPVKASHKTICSKCNAKRPYPFQIDGMKAINRGLAIQRGFAVLDSMGLGKTIQALGYIKFLPKENLPVLFVVKAGLKWQFGSEIIRILGDKYFPQIITGGKSGIFPGLKTYIISYDTLRTFDTEKLKKLNIKLMVLDEVQQIKNPDSTRTGEVRELMQFIPKVLPLSGTPWKNRGSELYTMFNLLNPTKFPSYQHFLNYWVDFKMGSDGKYK
ncbi:MAG: SprT-like domain-containing protein, partial [Candidatus Sulfotelmatobacter sp.]